MTTTIEKIQKLRARTTSRGATEAEMDAAARSIGRLLMQDSTLIVTEGGQQETGQDNDSPVTFPDVRVVAATAKAVLVDIPIPEGIPDTEDGYFWFPRSQLVDGNEVAQRGDFGRLVVARWIAQQKGLVA